MSYFEWENKAQIQNFSSNTQSMVISKDKWKLYNIIYIINKIWIFEHIKWHVVME